MARNVQQRVQAQYSSFHLLLIMAIDVAHARYLRTSLLKGVRDGFQQLNKNGLPRYLIVCCPKLVSEPQKNMRGLLEPHDFEVHFARIITVCS